ncbi:MAG: copper homeostasis protein CutC [Odoribacteraceae bacterium]|jgi:copper homeostasis protein|nr:copper homeostasis protein CutC [Odoribacteraceae bacterium]
MMDSIKRDLQRGVEVEVCAYSLESCLNAQRAGATRVELCAGMYDGGTTPSAAQIAMARELLAIELSVMIRPRGGDFLYSDLEFEQMKEEIRFAKSRGADGVVLGILHADGSVDMERTRELVTLAAPLRVTFHRAFDMTRDLEQALEEVIRAGCYRILTSGGANRAAEGLDALRRLVRGAAGRVKIMAGSGVNAANAPILANIGVDAVHLSGKSSRDSRMVFRNPAVSMGGVPGIPEYAHSFSDAAKIEAVVKALQQKKATR